MTRTILIALTLVLIGSAPAHQIGEKSVSRAMVMSSLLPGAGQFYLGNVGKGFMAIGTELLWWGGATGFFAAGRLTADEARKSTPPRSDSMRTLSTAMYIGSGIFAAIALGWRAIMVSDVHDAAVAHNYRNRYLDLRIGLEPELDGVTLGLSRRL